jgi:Zn-dependent M28 family amino/carboxypeptidase
MTLHPIVLASLLVAATTAIVTPSAPAAPPVEAGASGAARITADALRADIAAISHDSTQGRLPGTPGDRMTRDYLARRLRQIGFQPGVAGRWWEQEVTLVGLTVQDPAPWTFDGDAAKREVFRWGDDYIGGPGVQTTRVEIPRTEVVFVGYGIRAPEYQWNDFKNADLAGKVLLVLNNDPDWDPKLFAGRKRLYYGRWDYKYAEAARHRAAGVILVHTDASAGYPWAVVRRSWSGVQFQLPADGEPRLALQSWMSEDAARRLCALGEQGLDDLIAKARSADFRPVPLGVSTSIAFDVRLERTRTANVVGLLPGNDPQLARQAVLLTAHHDHLGVGEPDETGDGIHNGALDNASGCAQILAVADALAASPPKRSVVVAFVAAEEQGLLGSRHYATNPTVPLADLVMNLNVDGGNMRGRTADVAIIGRGKSDLEDRLAALAAKQFRSVVDEPEPDKGYYYRSDQFNLARVGVPAIYFQSGQSYIGRASGWGRQQEAEYRRLHYHQPSDELTPQWDFAGMVEDAKLAYELVRQVANESRLPAWYSGDEFAEVRRKSQAGATTPK